MSIINLNNMKNRKITNMESNKIKKNSGIMEKSLIQYINEGFSADFEKLMKKGYQEMAEINLEYSKLGFEYMLDDVNEYEAWICGV
jgi:CopG family transcriptional regulator/antitoxin EndoAI